MNLKKLLSTDIEQLNIKDSTRISNDIFICIENFKTFSILLYPSDVKKLIILKREGFKYNDRMNHYIYYDISEEEYFMQSTLIDLREIEYSDIELMKNFFDKVDKNVTGNTTISSKEVI